MIRHLEDAFAKSESKLTNFPELKLSEADRCSVLLQSLSAEVRQYVVLHGKSDDWEALRKSLTYYEEQLRLCDLPGSARALSDVLCDYCGKKGHKAEQCWQKKRDEKAAAGGPGKGKGDHEKKGKGRGDQTPKGARTPRGSEKGRGDKGKGDKGKEKGKDKWKKGPKGPKKHKKGKDKGRSLTEPESEEESGGGATLMALRFSAPAGGRPSPRLSEVPVLSPSEKPPPADVASKPAGVGPNGPAQREDPASESMGSLGTRFARQGDVNHVCKALEATAGDVWLVDSGATCHIVSAQHLSGFRVVKKHERTANLFNASGGSIVVSGVVDLEVHFGDVFLRLEEVLVAEVGFNVISPWTASERGWKTFLAKGGSRLYKGNKKSIKLMGAQRAWWAVSGSKKNPKRQPKGAVPMEIDSISEGPKPGRCAGTALPGPALTGPEAPPGILKNRRKEAEYEIEAPGAQNPLSGTPFSFLFRGFVSDFSVSGPSEAPVFRDEAPEVHEVSLGEPSLLRKEHELEVVEHDCAHEFSEACSDFEFFPERPKAFRKLWHGVSMFELVRKPCSLNFGMLGLFGMIGMTLLLAAVFAFVAFGSQGDDGQFVAYGRDGTSAAYGRDGTRDGTSVAYGRGCPSARAEWWYDRCAYYAGSSDFARDWWSGLGNRTCGGRALGERVGFCLGHFAKLCRSRGRTGSCINTSSSGAVTWGGAVQPVARCGACCRSSAGEVQPVACCDACCRSSAGSCPDDQAEDEAWGPWRAPEVAPLEGRAPDVSSSEAQAPVAASSEAQDVRDVKRPRRGIPAGSRARVGAVPTPNESEEDLLKQVFQRELEVRRQEGEALGLRLRAEADEPLPLLSHFYGPPSPSQMYDSLALCLTDRSFLARVALWLQTPKAAAAKPRPVQPRTPTTPAEESSDSSSEGVSEVSGESQLEGEGVAESIGILRSLGTETLWQPGVITRVFGTPALPPRLFPEVGAAAALGEKSAGDASSSNPAAGTAAGTPAMAPPTPAATPAMAPPTPAATEPKSPASLASVIYRPGRLVAKTLLASDGSTVPLPPGVPPRHVLPQPPPPPSKSPSAQPPQDPLVPSKGQTQQEREFTLPSPLGAASSAPLGATASETGTQFADYEAVVEAAKAAMERASRDL